MLSGVPGLYQTGFAIGVCGIVYSAYSLVKVGEPSVAISAYPTEKISHTIGEALKYHHSVRVCPTMYSE